MSEQVICLGNGDRVLADIEGGTLCIKVKDGQLQVWEIVGAKIDVGDGEDSLFQLNRVSVRVCKEDLLERIVAEAADLEMGTFRILPPEQSAIWVKTDGTFRVRPNYFVVCLHCRARALPGDADHPGWSLKGVDLRHYTGPNLAECPGLPVGVAMVTNDTPGRGQ